MLFDAAESDRISGDGRGPVFAVTGRAPGSGVALSGAEVAMSVIDLDARSGSWRATVRDLRALAGSHLVVG
ncbi:hypothetical protein GV794_02705 [Nocardia cyriacigeorgica]|uniref:Uncharacterized protein n=1 Tax=Nocardia cyriacigeorgica TaxID=135487 RepID=A0ABX0CET9_9NOCA|nr:hypothetical protein [Nocardia cyriacigeorgica]NEW54579.1 hypothetical protein [Nocardia cyriacigeorgica]